MRSGVRVFVTSGNDTATNPASLIHSPAGLISSPTNLHQVHIFVPRAHTPQRTIDRCKYEVRTTILGHTQRGGSPSARDRVLASRLGYMAVRGLLEGRGGQMVGVDRWDTVYLPLNEVLSNDKEVDWQLVDIAQVLAV